MAKVFFKLPGYYEGLTARRIKQSGRLWFVRVVSDPDKRDGSTFKPYWFVLIKGFNPVKDKASGATSIGVWRFGCEEEAFAKFAELEPLYPPYVPSPAQQAARNRMKQYLIEFRTACRAKNPKNPSKKFQHAPPLMLPTKAQAKPVDGQEAQ